MMNCTYCKSQNVVKNGKYRGKQRYLCKVCGAQFTHNSKNYDDIRIKMSFFHRKCNLTMKDIANIFHISESTVYYHFFNYYM